MRLFGRNKLKTFWSFSQDGNIFRFIFGGNKYIIGETRDTEGKKLNLFTLDYTKGKIFLKNFSFENNNYWVSAEGATEKMFFLGRFEKPELPYQIHIIAVDIETGAKLWENETYSYLYNTENTLFGIKKGFESNLIAEIDMSTGKVKRELSTDEHLIVFNLRNENEDALFENSNYPVLYSEETTGKELKDIFEKICFSKNKIGTIEYIQKPSLLIFNYYIKLTPEESGNAMPLFENRFIVYDTESGEIKFEDILNKTANYCVPDNFFTKHNHLFFLKEKKELHCIKLI